MEALRLDIVEIDELLKQASRTKVVENLTKLKMELNQELSKLTVKAATPPTPAASGDQPKNPKIFTTTIKTYGWDQSDKFVKIYVSNLNGVQNIPKENVTISFADNHYKLTVGDLNGKNHELNVPKLLYNVVSATAKVKTDMVVIMFKKETQVNWEALSVKEKEVQDKKNDKFKTPSMDSKDADPSKGIMDMMKKMYDEGDDEMKRTIAKAWTESRDKKEGGGMPGMPGM